MLEAWSSTHTHTLNNFKKVQTHCVDSWGGGMLSPPIGKQLAKQKGTEGPSEQLEQGLSWQIWLPWLLFLSEFRSNGLSLFQLTMLATLKRKWHPLRWRQRRESRWCKWMSILDPKQPWNSCKSSLQCSRKTGLSPRATPRCVTYPCQYVLAKWLWSLFQIRLEISNL